MTSIRIRTRKVIHRSLNYNASMSEFIASFSKKESKEEVPVIEKTITICKPENLRAYIKIDPALLQTNGLSFAITSIDAAKILNQLIDITTNPILIAELLKDLDSELGTILQKNNINFKPEDLPEFLIEGWGNFIPGPPPNHYRPKKKSKLLDKILLAREGANNINVEGVAPKFTGFVDELQAAPFLAAGHLFTEHNHISRILLHGSDTHRIMFDAFSIAFKTGKLDLTYDNGKQLTLRQLLELLVMAHYFDDQSNMIFNSSLSNLWNIIHDTLIDSVKSYCASDYNFSCRSPFVFNSFLLCFGQVMGLPHLQYYLLGRHWNTAYKMVHRVKNSLGTTDFSDQQLYLFCMEAFTTTARFIGDIQVKLPFTLTENQALLDVSIQPFDEQHPIAGVMKKVKLTCEAGEYDSWQTFFQSLKKETVVNYQVIHPEMTLSSQTFIELLCQFNALQRRSLFNELGKDKISKLFSDIPTFSAAVNKLQLEGRRDIVRDLFLYYNNDPIDDILMNKHRVYIYKTWYGFYNLISLMHYLYELEEKIMRRAPDYMIQLVRFEGTYQGGFTLVYNKYAGWSITNADSLNPVVITSQDTNKIASIIFQTLAADSPRIKLYTKFKRTRNDFEIIPSGELADQQVLNSLSLLSTRLSKDELKSAKVEFMQDAFKNNKYDLCMELIMQGVDFYACGIDKTFLSKETHPILFNDLCEAQAKFNIVKLRKTILNTDWQLHVFGKRIYDHNNNRHIIVPAKIKAEWDITCSARFKLDTYYSAWIKIIELRQNAAQQMAHSMRFFHKTPELNHYSSVQYETPVIALI